MQSTKKSQSKPTTAKELLSASLQELNGLKGEGDTTTVAAKLGITSRTVETYLRGDVALLETGKAIFKTLKDIIIKRDNDIKKLVA